MGPAPLFPARIPAHVSSTVLPSGETAPMPVITTRRCDIKNSCPPSVTGMTKSVNMSEMRKSSYDLYFHSRNEKKIIAVRLFRTDSVIFFSYLYTADFTADRLRKFFDEFDNTRMFITRCLVFYVVLQLDFKFFRRLESRIKNNGCFYKLTAFFIFDAGYRAFENSRMLHEHAFNFEGTDAVAGTLDNVIIAAHKPEIAVFVEVRRIAGVIKTAVERCSCKRHIMIISCKKTERSAFIYMNDNFAGLAGFAFLSVRSDNVDVISGSRLAHRARFRFHARKVSDNNGGFRLTVCFVHFKPGLFIEFIKNL